MAKGLREGMEVEKQPKCRKRKVAALTPEERKRVEDNLDLANYAAYAAVSETRGFTGCLTFEDLKSVAYYALCVAAKDFEPERGFTFRTYASRKAKGYVQHALRDTSRMVKVPRFVFKHRDDVRQNLRSGMTVEECALALGISQAQVVECEESWGQIHMSFDSFHLGEEGEGKGFEPPSYDPDEVERIGRSILLELGKLPEQIVSMLNQYYYGSPSERGKLSAWEKQFCSTFFQLYRNKVNQGVSRV